MLGRIVLNRYKVVKFLGSGAFGKTYLAEELDVPDKPPCVIKQLQPQTDNSASFASAKALFNREAEALFRLGKHEQIPQLFDYFEEEGEFYLAEEYVQGETLRAELRNHQAWDEAKGISFLRDTLQVLHYIHEQGIIHRDIKPENIIRRHEDQKLFLIDFGAVKQISLLNQEQPSPTIVHSRGYSPPEQLAGIPQPNSDIYALGMTCVEALAKVKPEALTDLRDPKTRELTLPESVRISAEFESILTKMVEIDSRERYQTVSDVMQALQALLNSTATDLSVNLNPQLEIESENVDTYSPTEISLRKQTGCQLYTLTETSVNTFNSQTETLVTVASQTSDKQEQIDRLISKIDRHQLKSNLNPTRKITELSDYLDSTQKQFKPITHIVNYASRRRLLCLGFLAFVSIGLISTALLVLGSMNPRSQVSQMPKSTDAPQQIEIEKQDELQNHRSEIKLLNFASDDISLISGEENGSIQVYDFKQKSVKRLIQLKSRIRAAVSNSQQQTLAVATEAKAIEIWSLAGKKINQISTEQLIWSLALSQNNQFLAYGELGRVRVVEKPQQNQRLTEKYKLFYKSSEPIRSLAFSPDASTLAGGSADGAIKILKFSSNSLLTLNGHLDDISSVAISPDSRTLISNSADNTIRIWDMTTAKDHLSPIQSDLGDGKAVAMSSDEKLLAAGGFYGTVKIWDLQTGNLLASISEYATEITALAFSQDGRLFAIGDRDGRIRIYKLRWAAR
ncbi:MULTISPECIES: serine/threonine-protein kinase [Trichocoleus]|uniref:non-specific serine/threonine protein kinase n=1 Tax=Trichocoleus desertorum GB2-A4 TaxID=2933944 RepID=A0ABV0JFQ0_9CYAN|nr:serine/threonine-protein kinase [Trichocoleus sp. FACHB-46]MBD1860064.1 serine/threonine protein kinase [Trichocoleus sp. FACHB-46]